MHLRLEMATYSPTQLIDIVGQYAISDSKQDIDNINEYETLAAK